MTRSTAHFAAMPDVAGYLSRMAKPLAEKLYLAHFIPPEAKDFLDVGCADGTVTIELAAMFPKIQFLGVDLDGEFIAAAQRKAKERGLTNVEFQKVYLRELLSHKRRFDVVQFCSVLHEFYSYGEGISSVAKALMDAHELLRAGGLILIRDMILEEFTKGSDLRVGSMNAKIHAWTDLDRVRNFIGRYGLLDCVYRINHLALKYMYVNNWSRELNEDYVAVTVEQYKQIFALLGMKLEHVQSYVLPYLHNRWKSDLDFTDDEIAQLRSTTIMVAEKPAGSSRR